MRTIEIEVGKFFSNEQEPFTYQLHSYLVPCHTYDLEIIFPYGYDRKPEYRIKLRHLEERSFIDMIVSIVSSLIKTDGDIEDWEMWLEDLQNTLNERKERKLQREKAKFKDHSILIWKEEEE